MLDVVKKLYDGFDFPESLAKEQKIEKGRSVPEDLVPVGPCLIDPDPTFPFSSLLIPLAAAVSAGSAAVVLASSSDSSSASTSLIRKIVSDSLDPEAIAITADASSETRQQLGSQYFAVAALQNREARQNMVQLLTRTNSLVRILAPPSGVPAVFVDRSTGDLEAVAAHLKTGVLRGRCLDAFRAPRLCFVDEFIIDRLVDLLDGPSEAGDKPKWSTGTNVKDVQALHEKLGGLFPSFGSNTSGPIVQLSTKE